MLKTMVGREGFEPSTNGLKVRSNKATDQSLTGFYFQDRAPQRSSAGAGVPSNFQEQMSAPTMELLQSVRLHSTHNN